MGEKRAILLIQGEGRGHTTQAIAVSKIIKQQNIRIVAVVIGGVSAPKISGFWDKSNELPVFNLKSPRFITNKGRGVNLWKTSYNTIKEIPAYLKSIRKIHQIITYEKPDYIFSFYEPLFALYNFFYRSKTIRKIAIGHQYEYLHEAYQKPNINWLSWILLKEYSRFTAYGADKIFAISIGSFESSKNTRLKIIPPLLRSELLNRNSVNEGFILVYIVNEGYMDDVMKWHSRNSSISIHCFTDSKLVLEKGGKWDVNSNLHFHSLNGKLFMDYLSRCAGLCSTAGFETITEAIWFEKPIMVIPVEDHVEQKCNADFFKKLKLAVAGDSFDLDPLLRYMNKQISFSKYKEWINSAERFFLAQLP